jgi:hypothetical protein
MKGTVKDLAWQEKVVLNRCRYARMRGDKSKENFSAAGNFFSACID